MNEMQTHNIHMYTVAGNQHLNVMIYVFNLFLFHDKSNIAHFGAIFIEKEKKTKK